MHTGRKVPGKIPAFRSSESLQVAVTIIAQYTQPVKIDLTKKLDSKQKTVQIFNIDAQGFRKSKNENPPTWEMGVTS